MPFVEVGTFYSRATGFSPVATRRGFYSPRSRIGGSAWIEKMARKTAKVERPAKVRG